MTKYKAKRTTIDGITFDSGAEARRYTVLKMLVRAGEIRELELQKPYNLMVKNVKIGVYKADFVYWDNRKNALVVEDVKGFRTDLYQWKRRHFAAQYAPLEITEVKA